MGNQITLNEFVQLKKFMGLTFSIHDAEALAGLRKANAILIKYDLSWAEILSRTVTVGGGSELANNNVVMAGSDELSIHEQIERAFNEIRGTVTDGSSFKKLLDSLEDQFERTGYLSAEQRKPLFDAVRRHRATRRKNE